jgi:putative ABC transport system permease protein
MKAIGASRRQIARIYRRTTLILGGIGAVLGVVVANVLTAYFANPSYGLNAGSHIDPAILIASVVVGLLGPPLAALPAIRRASRLPVHEARRPPARRWAARVVWTRCCVTSRSCSAADRSDCTRT